MWKGSFYSIADQLILFPIRMAFHTVLIIIDPFIQMFFTYFAFFVFVTTLAGVGCKAGGMAGRAAGAAPMI